MRFRVTPAKFRGLELQAIEKVCSAASQLLGRLNVTLRAMRYEGSQQLTSVHGPKIDVAARPANACSTSRAVGSSPSRLHAAWRALLDTNHPATAGHYAQVRKTLPASTKRSVKQSKSSKPSRPYDGNTTRGGPRPSTRVTVPASSCRTLSNTRRLSFMSTLMLGWQYRLLGYGLDQVRGGNSTRRTFAVRKTPSGGWAVPPSVEK